MQRSLWLGLILVALGTSAFADPQAKVRKVSSQENSYTYYNWKPNKPKVQVAPAAPAPVVAAPTAPAYAPIRPTPALLNPAAAGGYVDPNPAPPTYYGPGPQSYYAPAAQGYYANPGFNSGFYSSGYSYPGLSVSNRGFNAGLSINGLYRNGNVTIQAGAPGFYGPGPGFYGPGFQGGGFQGHRGGFQGGMPNSGFRGGFVPRR
ncbi:MAG: hypothetical protein J0I12_10975 [Candidatus Eremiobacteraeota bacterium]|nr:hypothetical protein [Candidatus Eremiobacteraeota bacterium]